MIAELHSVVSGKVQGVGFRDYVAACAYDLNLNGFVRNKENGTVEVVAQGILDDIRELNQRIQEGTPLSCIDEVKADIRTASVVYDEFKVVV